MLGESSGLVAVPHLQLTPKCVSTSPKRKGTASLTRSIGPGSWWSFGTASVALAGSPALTGCGANLQNALTDGPVACTRAIAGQVHSGVFPIQSATVRLAQTVASSSSGCGSTATTLGLATTDTDGNFSFSQTYTCSAASQFAYITVTGGHSLWRGADTGRGTLIEIIGLGAPCWPQLSYANPGSMPN